MFRFLRRENLSKQSQQSVSCPAINNAHMESTTPDSSSESDEELAEVSRKQRMFARKSIRRDRKKQKEQQKKIEKNIISMDDFLSKQSEFKIWLKEEKHKTVGDMKSPKLKTYFKDFMKLWNKKKLAQKYYRGSSSSDTPPSCRKQRFSIVEGSPFPDVSGLPQTIDLSLEGGSILDSPFSTFGKSPGDPLTPHSTPRLFKLPDFNASENIDKENTNSGMCETNLNQQLSGKKKKKTKNTTPKKSKLKNDNPYKVTVLSWTSKGELNVNAAASPSGTSATAGAQPEGGLNTSIPYQEVRDARNLDTSDYDPLYADPDPLLNRSVSRSKSLDSGLQLDSLRTVDGAGCKSSEEIYAVPVKKKRRSIERGNLVVAETTCSPPPPLPPKRKLPLESWPYQMEMGNAPVSVFGGKNTENYMYEESMTTGESDIRESGGSLFGYDVAKKTGNLFSPTKTDSPARMARSMPDLCDAELDESSSSTSSSSSSSSSENESESETFELKVKVLDPAIQEFLDAGLSDPLPPPPVRFSEVYPPIRLSLLPPPPPELLMDTPPTDDEYDRTGAFNSVSSLTVERGTPRSSKILEEDEPAHSRQNKWSLKFSTPTSVLALSHDVIETPPPMLVPITPFTLSCVTDATAEISPDAPASLKDETTDETEVTHNVQPRIEPAPHPTVDLPAPVQVSELKMSPKSRRISVGPLLMPPPPAALAKPLDSKKQTFSSIPDSSDSDTTSEYKLSSFDESPNHNYLEDAQTDMDTSSEKDEVFCYRQALSGAMKSLKHQYASVEDVTSDAPRNSAGLEKPKVCIDNVSDTKTAKYESINRHLSENSAIKVPPSVNEKRDGSMGSAKQDIPEEDQKLKTSSSRESGSSQEEQAGKTAGKKPPPVLKPKPSKTKVAEAVERVRLRQSSSSSGHGSTSSVSSTSSCRSSVSEPGETTAVHGRSKRSSSSSEAREATRPYKQPPVSHRPVQRVLEQLNQNSLNRRPSPKKPPRTSSLQGTRTVHSTSTRTVHSATRSPGKSILKQRASSSSENRMQTSAESMTLKSKAIASARIPAGSDVFETDIDSAITQPKSENVDPNLNSNTRVCRETDLDKILEEMHTQHPLSPLTIADTTSDVTL